MTGTRQALARELSTLLQLMQDCDPDDYSTIEQRLIDNLVLLGNELSIRLAASPLRRIAIEHDLHRLTELPILQELTVAQRGRAVDHMADPRVAPDG